MTLFPERLHIARIKRGISQRQLGRLCDLSINQINRYENGLTEPSAGVLTTLARVLEVSTDYLVGLVNDPKEHFYVDELNATEQELVDTFRHAGWPGVIHLGADKVAK